MSVVDDYGVYIGVLEDGDINLALVYGGLTSSDIKNRTYYWDGRKTINEPALPYTVRMGNNSTIGVLLDIDKGEISFTLNGVNMGIADNNISELGTFYPAIGSGTLRTIKDVKINFGSKPFKYTVPSGYLPYDYENALWFK